MEGTNGHRTDVLSLQRNLGQERRATGFSYDCDYSAVAIASKEGVCEKGGLSFQAELDAMSADDKPSKVNQSCWPACLQSMRPGRSKAHMVAQATAPASNPPLAKPKAGLLRWLSGQARKTRKQHKQELQIENLRLAGRVDIAEQHQAVVAQHAAAAVDELHRCQKTVKDLTSHLATSKKECSELMNSMASLEHDKANSLAYHQELEEALAAREAQLVGVRAQRDQLDARIEVLDSRNSRLSGQLAEVTLERDKLNVLWIGMANISKELKKARKQAALSQELCTAANAQLTSERKASAEKVAAMEMELTAARATTEALQTELAGKESLLAIVTQEKEAATTDAAALREKLAALSSELTDTCQVLESKLASQRSAHPAEYAELEAKINTLLATQACELAASRKAFDEKVAALSMELSSERDSCEALQSELHAKDVTLAAITREKKAAADDAASLRGQMAAMTTQLADAFKACEEALASECAATAAAQGECMLKLSKLSSTPAQGLESSRKALEGEVATLEEEVASLTTDKAGIKSRLADQRGQPLPLVHVSDIGAFCGVLQ